MLVGGTIASTVVGCTVGIAVVGTALAVTMAVLFAAAAAFWVTGSGIDVLLRNDDESVSVSVTVSVNVGSMATAAGVDCWASSRALMIPDMRIAAIAPMATIAIIKGSPMARLDAAGEVGK